MFPRAGSVAAVLVGPRVTGVAAWRPLDPLRGVRAAPKETPGGRLSGALAPTGTAEDVELLLDRVALA